MQTGHKKRNYFDGGRSSMYSDFAIGTLPLIWQLFFALFFFSCAIVIFRFVGTVVVMCTRHPCRLHTCLTFAVDEALCGYVAICPVRNLHDIVLWGRVPTLTFRSISHWNTANDKCTTPRFVNVAACVPHQTTSFVAYASSAFSRTAGWMARSGCHPFFACSTVC